MAKGAAAATAEGMDGAAGTGKRGGKKKLVLIAAPALVAAAVAGLWFGGILPPLLGMGDGKHAADAHAAAETGSGTKPAASGHGVARPPAGTTGGAGHVGKAVAEQMRGSSSFMELPEIIANLNAGPRRASYVKIRPRIELARPEDEAAVRAAMPRVLDLFQTYLREMRPEELRGSAGTYRLREELIARANIALAPVRVVDVLFPEMLVQ